MGGFAGRTRTALVVVAVVAVVVRVAAVLVTSDGYRPGYDSGDFDRIATAIARTGHQPPATAIVPGRGASAFRPPALSYLLAGVDRIVGPAHQKRRWMAARLMQAVIGSLVAVAAALLAGQLAGSLAALIAGLFAALDPTLVMLSLSLLTEPLFLLATLVAAVAILRHRVDARRQWLVCAGASAGLAAMTRSNGFVVLLIVAAAALISERRRDLRGALLVIGCAVAVMVPWTIRNAVVLHSFIPVSTALGYTSAGLYQADADEHNAQWRVPAAGLREFRREHPRGGEPLMSRALSRDAADYLEAHPAYLLEVGFWNTLRLLDAHQPSADRVLQEGEGIDAAFARAGVYGSWITLPLIAVGLLLGGAKMMPRFLWIGALLLAASAIFLGGGNARYRAPVEVILIGGAAAGYAARLPSASRPT